MGLSPGPLHPQTHHEVISPAVECVIVADIFSSCQNPHIGFLTCGGRAIMVEKAKCKPLELPLPREIAKTKAVLNSWRDGRD
jgi:hypothetical protein